MQEEEERRSSEPPLNTLLALFLFLLLPPLSSSASSSPSRSSSILSLARLPPLLPFSSSPHLCAVFEFEIPSMCFFEEGGCRPPQQRDTLLLGANRGRGIDGDEDGEGMNHEQLKKRRETKAESEPNRQMKERAPKESRITNGGTTQCRGQIDA